MNHIPFKNFHKKLQSHQENQKQPCANTDDNKQIFVPVVHVFFFRNSKFFIHPGKFSVNIRFVS